MPTAPNESRDFLPSSETVRPIDLGRSPGPKPTWHIAAGVGGGVLSASAVAWMLDNRYALYTGAIAIVLVVLAVFKHRRDHTALRLVLAVASTIAAAIPIVLVIGMYELRRILVLDVVFLPAAIVGIVAYVRAVRWANDEANLLHRAFGDFVGEWEGVQFVLLFPKGRIVSASKVWAIVQNATDAERSLDFYLEEHVGPLSGAPSLLLPEPETFQLQAGECAVLVADVGVAPGAKEQTSLHGALYVDRVGEVGSRLLRWHAPVVIPRSLGQARSAEPDSVLGLLALYGGHTVSITHAGPPVEANDLHIRMYPMTPDELASAFGLARRDATHWSSNRPGA